MEIQTLAQRIKCACEHTDDLTFHANYSGRGMYGTTCIGVSGNASTVREMITEVATGLLDETFDATMDGTEDEAFEVWDKMREQLTTLLNEQSSDQLGYGIVIYWATVQCDDEGSDEE